MTLPYPDNAKHKAVFALPYEEFDGPYAGKSDCKYLTVGWAQYDPGMVSVKTLRHSGERWSRQSEELPVHRAVDAVLLLAYCVFKSSEQGVTLPAGTFEGQKEPLTLSPKEHQSLVRFLRTLLTDDLLKRRLSKAADLLCELRKQGVL